MSKTVIARIESAVAAADVAITSCQSTKNAKQILTSLSQAVVILENTTANIPKRSRTFLPARKSLAVLCSALDGLYQGVASRDITVAEFRSELDLVREKFVARANESVGNIIVSDSEEPEAVVQSNANKEIVVRDADFKDALEIVRKQVISHSAEEEHKKDLDNPVLREHERAEKAYHSRDEKLTAALRAKIEHAASLKSTLPIRLKGMYQVFKLPVVPLFDTSGKKQPKSGNPAGGGSLIRNFSGSRLLDSLGISHIMVNDYLILESQLILAVNVADIEEYSKGIKAKQDAAHSKLQAAHRTKVNKLKANGLTREDIDAQLERPKKTKTQISPLDFVNSVIEAINEKAPSKYTLVTEYVVPNPRNSDIKLYWIMPRKVLSALLSKGWQRIKVWGFPW